MRQVKQLIIVRNDLRSKLRHGKLAAQVAHASMAAFLQGKELDKDMLTLQMSKPVEQWITGPFTKVVVRADDLIHLEACKLVCEEADIPVAKIHDAGRTVFSEPTTTCIGVGPWWSDDLDLLFSNLKMY